MGSLQKHTWLTEQKSEEDLKLIDDIVRTAFAEKRSGVYSLIVNCYSSQIEKLKPYYFIKWLVQRLKMNEEEINYSSLIKTISRSRKNKEV